MRLVAGLLLAGIAALLAGMVAAQIVSAMPCHGEGLACNIDTAIGAYAVPILTAAGTVLFPAIVLLAGKRVSLGSGLLLLLVPLGVFTAIGLIEVWTVFGLQPYPDLRQMLSIFAPAAIAAVTQWLVLRTVLRWSPDAPTA
jgi:hypothetical protein